MTLANRLAAMSNDGNMIKVRDVRGVSFKSRIYGNRAPWMSCAKHQAVMYDEGVQFESDGGATFFEWDAIDQVFV